MDVILVLFVFFYFQYQLLGQKPKSKTQKLEPPWQHDRKASTR